LRFFGSSLFRSTWFAYFFLAKETLAKVFPIIIATLHDTLLRYQMSANHEFLAHLVNINKQVYLFWFSNLHENLSMGKQVIDMPQAPSPK
jgi:hypothetical protein